MRWAAGAAAALLLTGCSSQGTDGDLVLFAALRGDGGPGGYRAAAGELTAERGFDALGLSGPAAVSGDPELPELTADLRRFAFVLVGCRHDSARLRISDGVAAAELLEDGTTTSTACAVPVYFLAVFDVPADTVPDGVLLG